MKKPILVVMAAGMGSRYGGLKQIDPVGSHGELIIDYSIFDARRAGFETVVFIIKEELEADFRQAIGDRLSRVMEVRYAFQNLADLPAGRAVPEGRAKPWGTAHAVLSAREVIDAPFAVINADDYYGVSAFRTIFDYLTAHPDRPDRYEYVMVGYLLKNTVSEAGHVARGVCALGPDGALLDIVERTRIERRPEGLCFTENDGADWSHLPDGTIVSLNMWGFHPSFLTETARRFPAFLDRAAAENPLKAEYFLPAVVSQLLEEGRARVRVLSSPDRWYGVTYQADKPLIVEALARMTREGVYPARLWEDVV